MVKIGVYLDDSAWSIGNSILRGLSKQFLPKNFDKNKINVVATFGVDWSALWKIYTWHRLLLYYDANGYHV